MKRLYFYLRLCRHKPTYLSLLETDASTAWITCKDCCDNIIGYYRFDFTNRCIKRVKSYLQGKGEKSGE